MTKQEFLEIMKKLATVEMQIKEACINKRLGRGQTDMAILAGKLTAIDFMMLSKEEQTKFKKELDKC